MNNLVSNHVEKNEISSLDEFIVERLKDLLEQRQMSRYKLGKLTGLTQACLSIILKGKCSPTVYTIQKLCEGFGITPKEFFNTDFEKSYYVTKKDKDMLELWHTLDSAHQDAVIGFIQGMIAQLKFMVK